VLICIAYLGSVVRQLDGTTRSPVAWDVLTGEGADELCAGYRYRTAYTDDPCTLQRELRRSVSTMHDSNLQRVDRMTMAHLLEAGVPFLDPAVVEVVMQIPAQLKLRRDQRGNFVEKWILRRAFTDLLPDSIAWCTQGPIRRGVGDGGATAGTRRCRPAGKNSRRAGSSPARHRRGVVLRRGTFQSHRLADHRRHGRSARGGDGRPPDRS